MHYELWLDESGDFKSDLEGKNDTPSIVGGILIESGKLDAKTAQHILEAARAGTPEAGKKWVHGTDMNSKYYGQIANRTLQKLKEIGAELVIFENKEKVKIVNSDLTYLHILSEGIIQLFQTLGLAHDDIKLDIFPARRVKTEHEEFKEKGRIYLIKPEEYKERLQEKLDLGYARRSIRPHENKWTWDLKTASAREDARLMLADIVCHSWYRKADKRKFSDEERGTLLSFFDERFLFTAVERSTVASMNRHLAEGNIGEALYEWIIADEEWEGQQETPEEILHVILKRLKQLPDFAQQTQLSGLLNHLNILIQHERQFHKAKTYLLKLQDIVIPVMKQSGMNHYEFFFDVHLMLFTNATHQGDIELAETQMQYCRTYLPKLSQRWESFGMVLDYFVRESVHLINSYDYNAVIDNMNQMENLLQNTIELFPLALQDELEIDIEHMNAAIYGKVLGTRLQAHTYLSRAEKSRLALAREDSEKALKQFVNETDVARQRQYRSQIECEAGQFLESLKWLGRSVNVETDEAAEIVKHMLAADKTNKIFGFMHYTRLMAEAALQGEAAFSDKLFDAWNRLNVDGEILEHYPMQHPYQIILWKLGTYLITTGKTKAALERYEKAEAICLENKASWTLFSIVLAMKAEETFYLAKEGKKYASERKQAERRLRQHYAYLMEQNLPRAMRTYFAEWEPVLSEKELDYEKVFALSRTIPY